MSVVVITLNCFIW